MTSKEKRFFDLPIDALKEVIWLNLFGGAIIPAQAFGTADRLPDRLALEFPGQFAQSLEIVFLKDRLLFAFLTQLSNQSLKYFRPHQPREHPSHEFHRD